MIEYKKMWKHSYLQDHQSYYCLDSICYTKIINSKPTLGALLVSHEIIPNWGKGRWFNINQARPSTAFGSFGSARAKIYNWKTFEGPLDPAFGSKNVYNLSDRVLGYTSRWTRGSKNLQKLNTQIDESSPNPYEQLKKTELNTNNLKNLSTKKLKNPPWLSSKGVRPCVGCESPTQLGTKHFIKKVEFKPELNNPAEGCLAETFTLSLKPKDAEGLRRPDVGKAAEGQGSGKGRQGKSQQSIKNKQLITGDSTVKSPNNQNKNHDKVVLLGWSNYRSTPAFGEDLAPSELNQRAKAKDQQTTLAFLGLSDLSLPKASLSKSKKPLGSAGPKIERLPYFNHCFDKGRVKSLVTWYVKVFGENNAVELVEKLKELGFYYATHAGISIGIDDLKIPPKKFKLLARAETSLYSLKIEFSKGNLTSIERFQKLIETWHRTSESIKQNVIKYFKSTNVLNPIYMMAFSGARGNISQVRQLVGMRGLMSDPQGQILDFPIQSNFREGLTLTEYVISCYGARKGVVDTALRTAKSGYLTRRLVDVAQQVVVSKLDCGTELGFRVKDLKSSRASNKILLNLKERLVGRVLAETICLPTKTEYTSTEFEYTFRSTEFDTFAIAPSGVGPRDPFNLTSHSRSKRVILGKVRRTNSNLTFKKGNSPDPRLLPIIGPLPPRGFKEPSNSPTDFKAQGLETTSLRKVRWTLSPIFDFRQKPKVRFEKPLQPYLRFQAETEGKESPLDSNEVKKADKSLLETDIANAHIYGYGLGYNNFVGKGGFAEPITRECLKDTFKPFKPSAGLGQSHFLFLNLRYIGLCNNPPISAGLKDRGKDFITTSEGSWFGSEGPNLNLQKFKNKSAKKSGFIIVHRNKEISAQLATQISKYKKEVVIRSPLSCQAKQTVCQLCYGWSLSQKNLVALGEAVGVIAAQSIGEPGTQLTMRTFHTGGVFSADVLDQIYSPSSGKVLFPHFLRGSMIRTPDGKIAFFTPHKTFLEVVSGIQYDTEQRKNQAEPTPTFEPKLLQNQSLRTPEALKNNTDWHNLNRNNFKHIKISKVTIPPYTAVFVKQGEIVYKNQLIGETSFTDQNETEDDQSIETYRPFYSKMEGEVWFPAQDSADVEEETKYAAFVSLRSKIKNTNKIRPRHPIVEELIEEYDRELKERGIKKKRRKKPRIEKKFTFLKISRLGLLWILSGKQIFFQKTDICAPLEYSRRPKTQVLKNTILNLNFKQWNNKVSFSYAGDVVDSNSLIYQSFFLNKTELLFDALSNYTESWPVGSKQLVQDSTNQLPIKEPKRALPQTFATSFARSPYEGPSDPKLNKKKIKLGGAEPRALPSAAFLGLTDRSLVLKRLKLSNSRPASAEGAIVGILKNKKQFFSPNSFLFFKYSKIQYKNSNYFIEGPKDPSDFNFSKLGSEGPSKFNSSEGPSDPNKIKNDIFTLDSYKKVSNGFSNLKQATFKNKNTFGSKNKILSWFPTRYKTQGGIYFFKNNFYSILRTNTKFTKLIWNFILFNYQKNYLFEDKIEELCNNPNSKRKKSPFNSKNLVKPFNNNPNLLIFSGHNPSKKFCYLEEFNNEYIKNTFLPKKKYSSSNSNVIEKICANNLLIRPINFQVESLLSKYAWWKIDQKLFVLPRGPVKKEKSDNFTSSPAVGAVNLKDPQPLPPLGASQGPLNLKRNTTNIQKGPSDPNTNQKRGLFEGEGLNIKNIKTLDFGQVIKGSKICLRLKNGPSPLTDNPSSSYYKKNILPSFNWYASARPGGAFEYPTKLKDYRLRSKGPYNLQITPSFFNKPSSFDKPSRFVMMNKDKQKGHRSTDYTNTVLGSKIQQRLSDTESNFFNFPSNLFNNCYGLFDQKFGEHSKSFHEQNLGLKVLKNKLPNFILEQKRSTQIFGLKQKFYKTETFYNQLSPINKTNHKFKKTVFNVWLCQQSWERGVCWSNGFTRNPAEGCLAGPTETIACLPLPKVKRSKARLGCKGSPSPALTFGEPKVGQAVKAGRPGKIQSPSVGLIRPNKTYNQEEPKYLQLKHKFRYPNKNILYLKFNIPGLLHGPSDLPFKFNNSLPLPLTGQRVLVLRTLQKKGLPSDAEGTQQEGFKEPTIVYQGFRYITTQTKKNKKTLFVFINKLFKKWNLLSLKGVYWSYVFNGNPYRRKVLRTLSLAGFTFGSPSPALTFGEPKVGQAVKAGRQGKSQRPSVGLIRPSRTYKLNVQNNKNFKNNLFLINKNNQFILTCKKSFISLRKSEGLLKDFQKLSRQPKVRRTFKNFKTKFNLMYCGSNQKLKNFFIYNRQGIAQSFCSSVEGLIKKQLIFKIFKGSPRPLSHCFAKTQTSFKKGPPPSNPTRVPGFKESQLFKKMKSPSKARANDHKRLYQNKKSDEGPSDPKLNKKNDKIFKIKTKSIKQIITITPGWIYFSNLTPSHSSYLKMDLFEGEGPKDPLNPGTLVGLEGRGPLRGPSWSSFEGARPDLSLRKGKSQRITNNQALPPKQKNALIFSSFFFDRKGSEGPSKLIPNLDSLIENSHNWINSGSEGPSKAYNPFCSLHDQYKIMLDILPLSVYSHQHKKFLLRTFTSEIVTNSFEKFNFINKKMKVLRTNVLRTLKPTKLENNTLCQIELFGGRVQRTFKQMDNNYSTNIDLKDLKDLKAPWTLNQNVKLLGLLYKRFLKYFVMENNFLLQKTTNFIKTKPVIFIKKIISKNIIKNRTFDWLSTTNSQTIFNLNTRYRPSFCQTNFMFLSKKLEEQPRSFNKKLKKELILNKIGQWNPVRLGHSSSVCPKDKTEEKVISLKSHPNKQDLIFDFLIKSYKLDQKLLKNYQSRLFQFSANLKFHSDSWPLSNNRLLLNCNNDIMEVEGRTGWAESLFCLKSFIKQKLKTSFRNKVLYLRFKNNCFSLKKSTKTNKKSITNLLTALETYYSWPYGPKSVFNFKTDNNRVFSPRLLKESKFFKPTLLAYHFYSDLNNRITFNRDNNHNRIKTKSLKIVNQNKIINIGFDISKLLILKTIKQKTIKQNLDKGLLHNLQIKNNIVLNHYYLDYSKSKNYSVGLSRQYEHISYLFKHKIKFFIFNPINHLVKNTNQSNLNFNFNLITEFSAGPVNFLTQGGSTIERPFVGAKHFGLNLKDFEKNQQNLIEANHHAKIYSVVITNSIHLIQFCVYIIASSMIPGFPRLGFGEHTPLFNFPKFRLRYNIIGQQPKHFKKSPIFDWKQKNIFVQNLAPSEPGEILKFYYKKERLTEDLSCWRRMPTLPVSLFLLTPLDQITFATNNTNPIVKLGQFMRYGDLLTNNIGIYKSGQVLNIEKTKVTLRLAKPVLVSPGDQLHKLKGDFVTNKTPLLSLSYKSLKTGDIVQGIPKIEQLFEARQTKDGKPMPGNMQDQLYSLFLKFSHSDNCTNQQAVRLSLERIQRRMVDQIQLVYQSQGISIADKHLEIIVRQMTAKVRILRGGQTQLLTGELIHLYWIESVNKNIKNGGKATYEPVLLSITRAALQSSGFISAASFQETTRILARAAIQRKADFLRGLKENVVLGYLIPAGTGLFASNKLIKSVQSDQSENNIVDKNKNFEKKN